MYQVRYMTADDPQPKKTPLIFFRTLTGGEPVREWLKEPGRGPAGDR